MLILLSLAVTDTITECAVVRGRKAEVEEEKDINKEKAGIRLTGC